LAGKNPSDIMAATVDEDGAAVAAAAAAAAAEVTVTASMLAEEAGLQAKAEQELANMAVQVRCLAALCVPRYGWVRRLTCGPVQAQSEYDQLVERQRYSRLKFLLDKTTLYSNFLAQKLEDQRRQSQEKAQRKEEKARAQQDAATAAAADAPQRVGTDRHP
jgi:hypothetical protein